MTSPLILGTLPCKITGPPLTTHIGLVPLLECRYLKLRFKKWHVLRLLLFRTRAGRLSPQDPVAALPRAHGHEARVSESQQPATGLRSTCPTRTPWSPQAKGPTRPRPHR